MRVLPNELLTENELNPVVPMPATLVMPNRRSSSRWSAEQRPLERDAGFWRIRNVGYHNQLLLTVQCQMCSRVSFDRLSQLVWSLSHT